MVILMMVPMIMMMMMVMSTRCDGGLDFVEAIG
jgi:hypothetical protein